VGESSRKVHRGPMESGRLGGSFGEDALLGQPANCFPPLWGASSGGGGGKEPKSGLGMVIGQFGARS